MGTLERRGFCGSSKCLQKNFKKIGPPFLLLPRQYTRGVVQTDHKHTLTHAGLTPPYHYEKTSVERRQSQCQTDQIHHAGIPAVRRSCPTASSTVTSIDPSIQKTHALQAAEATVLHGTKHASVTLRRHPLCVECMKQGRYVKATDVDHIIPHRGDKILFWD